MTKRDFAELARKIAAATSEGMAAASAHPSDGGSANLDHIVIFGLKGVRLASLEAAGIQCSKVGPGAFRLSAPFPGQGDQRYVGVQAQADALKRAGVDCYVHYQMD